MLSWLRAKKKDPAELLVDWLGDYRLPSFPAVVTQALERLRDPDASLASIAEHVGADPEASVRLIRLANSPAYALRHPVSDVSHAVSLLGRAQVESLLLSIAVQGLIPASATDAFDDRRFWLGAGKRAAIAKSLADLVHPASASETFTASLLQDMAVPLLAHAKGEAYQGILASWQEGADLASLEQTEFGLDHGIVAGTLCRKWGLPERLAESIGAHHDPDALGALDVPIAVAAVALLPLEPSSDDVASVVERTHAQFGLPSAEIEAAVKRGIDRGEAVGAAILAR